MPKTAKQRIPGLRERLIQLRGDRSQDEIAKKFADMHNINIRLSVNGKNKVYEGIKNMPIKNMGKNLKYMTK